MLPGVAAWEREYICVTVNFATSHVCCMGAGFSYDKCDRLCRKQASVGSVELSFCGRLSRAELVREMVSHWCETEEAMHQRGFLRVEQRVKFWIKQWKLWSKGLRVGMVRNIFAVVGGYLDDSCRASHVE